MIKSASETIIQDAEDMREFVELISKLPRDMKLIIYGQVIMAHATMAGAGTPTDPKPPTIPQAAAKQYAI